MPSTYSSLKIQLMEQGENNNQWGNITNTNLGTAIEEAITGSVDVPFSSGPVTLTLTDTNTTQSARNLRLNLTGTSGGAQNLIVPAIEKFYVVNNGCADAITVKNSTGNGIAVPAGKTMLVFNTGTDVVDAVTHLTSLTLASSLPVTSGGTGATTFTSNGVLYGGATVGVTAAGADGQVLVGNTGGAPSWAAATGVAVTSINFGSTGLTPSTATQGVVTVAGTLASGSGGTGLTTFTAANNAIYSTSASALTAGTLPVAAGGTGRATSTTAYGLLAAGTTATGAQQTLATGATTEILVGGGTSALPVWTTATGSGAPVRATSPTLVTPLLGTPTSGTLTNCDGLPIILGTTGTLSVGRGGTGVTSLTSNGVLYGGATVGATAVGMNGQVLIGNTGAAPSWAAATGVAVTSISFGSTGLTPSTATQGVVTVAGTLAVANGGTGITSFGTGVATFLGTPTSANLAAAVTDETGSGSLVFATNPVLVTPTLGAASATSLALAAGLVATPSLTFTGDLNTGMWSPAADTIAWSTAGSERMRITSAGLVAIGITAAPRGDLDITSGADGTSVTKSIHLGYSAADFYGFRVANTNTAGSTYAGTFAIQRGTGTAWSSDLLVNDSGNVGIGTTSPTAKTEISYASTAPSLSGVTGAGLSLLGSSTLRIAFGSDPIAPYGGWIQSSDGVGNAFALNLNPLGGNVGIGLIDPSYPLEVATARAADVTTLSLRTTGAITDGDINRLAFRSVTTLDNNYRTIASVQGISTTQSGVSVYGSLAFSVNSATTLYEAMRIRYDGNVGIGTTSPSQKLDVAGNVYVSQRVGLGVAPSTTVTLKVQGPVGDWCSQLVGNVTTGQSYGLLIDAGTNTSDLSFLIRNASATNMFAVRGDGNVGIGTTSPVEKLDVVGNIELSGPSNKRISFYSATNWRYNLATTGDNFSVYDADNTNFIELFYSGTLAFKRASVLNALHVLQGGNVGIGTTGPVNKLQSTYTAPVSVPAAGASAHGFAVGDTGFGLAAGALNSGNAYLQATRWDGTATNYNLILQPNGGNVGIGVTNPGQALVVRREGDVRIYVEDDNASGRGGYLRSVTGGAVTLGTTSGVRDLVFAPDNSEAMRIAVGGNVGIGTSTTTGVKLTVAGSTAFSFAQFSTAHVVLGSTNSSGSLFINTPSLNGSFTSGLGISGSYASTTSTVNISAVGVYSGGGYGADLAFYTSADTTLPERMRIKKSGNVGIGTDSPSVPLQVRGDASSGGVNITTNTFTSGSAGSSLRLRHSATSGDTIAIVENLVAGGTTIGNIALNPSGGNVGIGCTPISVAKFQVSLATDRRFSVFANGADNALGYLDDAGNWVSTLVSGSPLRLGASGSEAMRIVSGGNVGIGTTTPDVFGRFYTRSVGISSSGSSGIQLNSATGSGAYFDMGVNGARTFSIYSDATDSQLSTQSAGILSLLVPGAGYIWFSTDGSERMRITSTGNVGIGTTDQFGTGTRVIGLANATANPSTNPTGGGVLYADAGALKWRGSSGTVTTIANA